MSNTGRSFILTDGTIVPAVVSVDATGQPAAGGSDDPAAPTYIADGVPGGSPIGPLYLRSDGARTGALPGTSTSATNLALVNVGGGAGVFTSSSRGALFLTAGATETIVIDTLSLMLVTSSGAISWADNGYGSATTALTNGLCLEIASGSVGAAGVDGTVVWRSGTGLTTYGAGTGYTINRDWREHTALSRDAVVIIANTRIQFPYDGHKFRSGGLVIAPGRTLRLVGQDTVTIGSMQRIELQVSGWSYTA